MNATEILALVSQGLALLPGLITAGVDVIQRIEAIKTVADAGAAGTLTDAQVQVYRDQLDADLADFNTPMDPA
jgi:NAD(P)H-dependent flavin oxidoreductase YrpB (nitropropane dioxygenase family)